jgi:hypothetical protein
MMNEYLLIPIFFGIGLWISIRCFGRLLDYVIEKGSGRGVQLGPWKTHLGVGRKGTPRIEKAAIARIGLGANDSEETIYWNAFTDNEGFELRAEQQYQITFRSAPPVKYEEKGFWSITVYGKDKFLVPNPYKKYMIHSDASFKLGEDVSYSIHLSRNKPAGVVPWIPLPVEDVKFSLAYRCYRPADVMKHHVHSLKMPEINRITR